MAPTRHIQSFQKQMIARLKAKPVEEDEKIRRLGTEKGEKPRIQRQDEESYRIHDAMMVPDTSAFQTSSNSDATRESLPNESNHIDSRCEKGTEHSQQNLVLSNTKHGRHTSSTAENSEISDESRLLLDDNESDREVVDPHDGPSITDNDGGASQDSDEEFFVEYTDMRTCLMADVKPKDIIIQLSMDFAPKGYYIIEYHWCKNGFMKTGTDPLKSCLTHVRKIHQDKGSSRYPIHSSKVLRRGGKLITDATIEWFNSCGIAAIEHAKEKSKMFYNGERRKKEQKRLVKRKKPEDSRGAFQPVERHSYNNGAGAKMTLRKRVKLSTVPGDIEELQQADSPPRQEVAEASLEAGPRRLSNRRRTTKAITFHPKDTEDSSETSESLKVGHAQQEVEKECTTLSKNSPRTPNNQTSKKSDIQTETRGKSGRDACESRKNPASSAQTLQGYLTPVTYGPTQEPHILTDDTTDASEIMDIRDTKSMSGTLNFTPKVAKVKTSHKDHKSSALEAMTSGMETAPEDRELADDDSEAETLVEVKLRDGETEKEVIDDDSDIENWDPFD